MKVDSEGTVIVAGLCDSSVEVFSAIEFRALFVIVGLRYPAVCSDISEFEGLVITCGVSPFVFLWRYCFGCFIESLLVHNGIIFRVMLLSGYSLTITSGSDMSVRVSDVVDRVLLNVVDLSFGVVTSILSFRNGLYVLTGGQDRVVRLFRRGVLSNVFVRKDANVFGTGVIGWTDCQNEGSTDLLLMLLCRYF